MKKLAPLGVLLLLGIAGLTVWLSRTGGHATGSATGDDPLALPIPAVPTARDDAAAPGATEPAAIESAAAPAAETQLEAPATPALPGWIPAAAVDAEHGAIAATVLLAPDVPAMGASAELSGAESRQAFSDQLGHLLAARLTPGRYRIAIGFAGYETVVRDGVTVEATRVTDLGAIDLGAATGGAGGPIAEVTVEVTAKEGGAAVPGATVTLTTVRPYGLYLAFGTDSRPGELTLSGSADAHGRIAFRGLRPGTYDVLAQADGFALGARPNLTIARATRARVALELPRGVAITGRVLHHDGTPADGAAVVGLNVSAGFKSYPNVMTDADGRFEFGGLDPGDFMILAFKEGHGMVQQFGVRAPKDGVELRLGVAATLSGQVVSAADGTPVTTFTVRPLTGGGTGFNYIYSMAYPFTDPEGRFSLTLDPGTYDLEVQADGYGTTTASGVPVQPPAEGASAPVVVQLAPTGAVHGLVRARGTGTPIVGAEVYLRVGGMPPSPHKTVYAVTGPEGRFRMDGLALTRLNLIVSHPEYSSGQITGVLPSAGEGTPVDVELSGGGAVAGRVLDAAGQPVANVAIHLFRGAELFTPRTQTSGPDGAYRFEPVTPGTWNLATGDLATQQGTNFRTVEVRDGEVARVDLGGLRAAGHAVSGHVTRNRAPVADVTVQLWVEGRTAAGDDSASMSARTAADGTFAVPNVAPGRYTAFVEIGGAVARAAVTVTADGPPPAVVLELREAAIRGRVRAADGKPLDGVWVTLERATDATAFSVLQNYQGQAYSDAEGAFAITGLPDGTYRLRAFYMMGGYSAALVDDLRVSGGMGVEQVDVVLGAPRQVTGKITTTNGTPIEGATLRVLDSQGRDFALIGFSSSGSDGVYTYGGLRADVYTIVAEAAGHAPAAATVNLSVAVSQVADFVLVAGATLKIVATDGTGTPVAGATIELRDGAGNLVTKGVSIQNLLAGTPATNAQGIGYWRDLAPASYRVRVVPIGGSPAEAQATAVAGQTVDVPIQLGG